MLSSVPLAKSTKGISEISNQRGELDLRSRQVLILADGKSTIEDLQRLRPNFDVLGIVKQLIVGGFLVAADGRKLLVQQVSIPTSVPVPSKIAIAPEQFEEARHLMLESIDAHLGILGSELRRKANSASDQDEIISCIAQWHMALRESRHGRTHADNYLQQVQHLLQLNPAQS